jgi:hypothetical protein
LKRDVVALEVARTEDHRDERIERLARAVSQLKMVQGTAKEGGSLKIYVESNEIALPQILETASSLEIPVHSISYSRPGLDEVFLHYTGHAFPESGENV